MKERIENHFCGMLVINKEAGYTSSDVISRLRGILHMKRIGHTGTLDPQAEGVLPVCLGNGTRVAELIADHDKEYVATMRLGVTTDTQDMTGTVLDRLSGEDIRRRLLAKGAAEEADRDLTEAEGSAKETDHDLTEAEVSLAEADGNPAETDGIPQKEKEESLMQAAICSAVRQFTGEISQVPPMYSAVWSGGRRLYELAREGKTVERTPRRVTIHDIEIQNIALPLVTLRVVCSKGTYIRTLCEDIGKALGTGAAMEHLLRTRVGIFTLEQALKLDDLQRMTDDDLLAAGILPDTTGRHFPEAERRRIQCAAADRRQKQDGQQTAAGRMQKQDGQQVAAGTAGNGQAESGPEASEVLVPEYSREAAGIAAHVHWQAQDHMIPIDALFPEDPAVHVREKDLGYLRNGNALSAANLVEGRLPGAGRIRVYDDRGTFCALYRYVPERRRILPLKMFIDTDSRTFDRG